MTKKIVEGASAINRCIILFNSIPASSNEDTDIITQNAQPKNVLSLIYGGGGGGGSVI